VTRAERWIARALLAYPLNYRRERGEEITATLIEASMWQPPVENLVDLLNVVVQGLRLRFALNANRRSGKVLGLAATPALVLAGGFALMLFIFGEWLPSVSRAPIALHFGPFMTAGPVVYLAWAIAAIGCLASPQHRRPLALFACAVTAALAAFGGDLHVRPPMIPLLVLVGLAIPSILGPSRIEGELSRVKTAAVGAGGIFVLLGFQAFNAGRNEFGGMSDLFYIGALRGIATCMPFVAVGVTILITYAVASRRTEWACSIGVIAAPWALIGARLPIGNPLTSYDLPRTSSVGDTGWLILVCLVLASMWVRDIARLHFSKPAEGATR
jgi:hypothetical protein